MTPVGGKKRRAWRLKKKYNKWFNAIISELVGITLQDIPQGVFEIAWSQQVYGFIRLYK